MPRPPMHRNSCRWFRGVCQSVGKDSDGNWVLCVKTKNPIKSRVFSITPELQAIIEDIPDLSVLRGKDVLYRSLLEQGQKDPTISKLDFLEPEKKQIYSLSEYAESGRPHPAIKLGNLIATAHSIQRAVEREIHIDDSDYHWMVKRVSEKILEGEVKESGVFIFPGKYIVVVGLLARIVRTVLHYHDEYIPGLERIGYSGFIEIVEE